MATITQAERDRRKRCVKAGEWDEAWVTLASTSARRETPFFAVTARLTTDLEARVEFRDSGGILWAIVDLADVEKVVH